MRVEANDGRRERRRGRSMGAGERAVGRDRQLVVADAVARGSPLLPDENWEKRVLSQCTAEKKTRRSGVAIIDE